MSPDIAGVSPVTRAAPESPGTRADLGHRPHSQAGLHRLGVCASVPGFVRPHRLGMAELPWDDSFPRVSTLTRDVCLLPDAGVR